MSRCLQFNLKRLDPDQIKSQLVRILETENIEYDDEALDLLARSADGSMRDGLSLLDQAIAFGAGKVLKEDIRKMLGSIEQRYIHALIESLANNDTDAMFQAIGDAADRSPDFFMVLDELLGSFYQLSLAQLAPAIIEQRSLDRPWLEQASVKFSAEQLQLYYQICLTGKRDLPLAPDSRTGFEMLMLRMLAFRPDTSALDVAVSNQNSTTTSPVHSPSNQQAAAPQPTAHQAAAKTVNSSSQSRQINASEAQDKNDAVYSKSIGSGGTQQASMVMPDSSVKISEPSPPADELIEMVAPDSLQKKKNWSGLVETLSITGLTKQLALHMAPSVWNETHLELLIDIEHDAIHSATREKELITALQNNLGTNLKITVRVDNPVAETPAQQKQRQIREKQEAAEKSILTDQGVNKIVDAFGATVAPGSIRPVN